MATGEQGGTPSHQQNQPQRGANRSTKVAGKLKVLPDQPTGDYPTQSKVLGSPRVDQGPPQRYGGSQSRRLATVEEETERPQTGSEDKNLKGNRPQDDEDEDDVVADEEDIDDADASVSGSGDADIEDAEVYNQIAQIPEGTARRDAIRLTKKKAKSLPRVTAYATASSYRLHDLMKFFQARRSSYQTNPRLLDEVIYTPYGYDDVLTISSSSHAQSSSHYSHSNSRSQSQTYPAAPPKAQPPSARVGDLLGVPELSENNATYGYNSASTLIPTTSGSGALETEPTQQQTQGAVSRASVEVTSGKKRRKSGFDFGGGTQAEVFMFEYGTVVIWGMTEAQEKRFLSSIKRFEVEKLAPEDIEMEDLNYYYANYSRIYNDVITLRRGSGFMTKLSLSHALAQSVKISLFEELISSTIEDTKDIPEVISETGKVGMPHKEIMRQIGELFLLRININLVGSVLDSPEVFWSYPDLQPLYEAARSYLEIPQRVNLLNTRVEVLQDMLQLLKESVSSRHSERLEQIVIALIGIEIVLGIITILVDLFS